jgi:hypothetical protein
MGILDRVSDIWQGTKGYVQDQASSFAAMAEFLFPFIEGQFKIADASTYPRGNATKKLEEITGISWKIGTTYSTGAPNAALGLIFPGSGDIGDMVSEKILEPALITHNSIEATREEMNASSDRLEKEKEGLISELTEALEAVGYDSDREWSVGLSGGIKYYGTINNTSLNVLASKMEKAGPKIREIIEEFRVASTEAARAEVTALEERYTGEQEMAVEGRDQEIGPLPDGQVQGGSQESSRLNGRGQGNNHGRA